MAVFKYKARNIDAKTLTGIIEAHDPVGAVEKLSERGLFTYSVVEQRIKKARYRMKSRQLADFSKQLSIMLKSGLPMVKCIGIIANGETVNLKIKATYLELHRLIKNGMSLSEAMKEQGSVFPEMIINMFYSGEMSGTMSEVANKMADYFSADHKLKKKISQATVYPKILLCLTVVALIVIFTFVLPTILDMLEGHELPPLTRFMAGISNYLVTKWYNAIIFVVVAVLLFLYLRSVKAVRLFYDMSITKIGVIGPLLRIIYTARFARTLSSLYGSGIQLVAAIGIAGKIVGNSYIQAQFPDIIKRVKQGEPFSRIIADTDCFNKKLENIILIGEETGRLDDILNFAAESFEYDADAAITSLLSILEPALLVLMAALIGGVIISVIMPIYQMYDTVGM